MAPKASSMKQGTINFASLKRTGSATNAAKTAATGGKANVQKAKPTPPVVSEKRRESFESTTSVASSRVTTEPSEAEDVYEISQTVSRPAKRAKVFTSGTQLAKGLGKTSVAKSQDSQLSKKLKATLGAKVANARLLKADEDTSDEEDVERVDLATLEAGNTLKDHMKYVKSQMGTSKPVHSTTLTDANHILRIFDLSYEFGPCVGVTRMERWKRAQAMGLNPPKEVHDILMTKEGFEKQEYIESVFYGEL